MKKNAIDFIQNKVFGGLFHHIEYGLWIDDLTELERRFTQIRASGDDLRTLLQSDETLLMTLIALMQPLWINQNAAAMYEAQDPEFLKTALPQILYSESVPAMTEYMCNIFEGKTNFSNLHTHLTLTGRRINTSVNTTTCWHEGHFFGICVFDDVTETQHLISQLNQQIKMAHGLEAIGALTLGVSHDFNNMLQAILVNAELAIRQSDMPKQKKFLEAILMATSYASDLTRSLLNWGNTGSMHQKKKEAVQIQVVIQNFARILKRTLPSNISLHVSTISDSDLWGYFYPGQLQQVLLNLCINARDAMELSGGALTISVREHCQKKFTIAVSDTGHGIADEHRDLIFDRFFSTKPKEKGSGLGLSIVNEIIQENQGEIDIESTIGQGTTFYLTLPRYFPNGEHSQSGQIAFEPQVQDSPLVIVADDQPLVRHSLAQALTHFDFEVIEAADGLSALYLAEQYISDLSAIILDLDMPKLDGLEVLRQIRNLGYQGQTILVTGLTFEVSKLDEHTTLITKPFSLDDVVDVLLVH